MFKKVNEIVAKLEEKLIDVLLLLIRLVLGQAFLSTGWGKLHNLEGVTQFFSSLGIPFPEANALFIGSLEFIGGLLLIFGLLNRVFSLLLTSTMLVAIFTADWSDFLSAFALMPEKGFLDVTPMPYLLFLLVIFAKTSGKFSIDHILRRKFETIKNLF